MSFRIFRQEWIAGAFVQPLTGPVDSFTATNVASRIIGAGTWRGISTILSGTSIVSVAATAARSGATILTTIYQYASIQSSQAIVVTGVRSVRAGAFEIVTLRSNPPVRDCPLARGIIDY